MTQGLLLPWYRRVTMFFKDGKPKQQSVRMWKLWDFPVLQKLEGMYTVLSFRTLHNNTVRSANIHNLGGWKLLLHTEDCMICMYIIICVWARGGGG